MKRSTQLVLRALSKLIASFEEKRRAQLEQLAFFSVPERRHKRLISILVTPDGLGWRDLFHEVRSSNLKFFPEATEVDATIVDEIWQCIEHPHLFSFAMPANGVAVRNAYDDRCLVTCQTMRGSTQSAHSKIMSELSQTNSLLTEFEILLRLDQVVEAWIEERLGETRSHDRTAAAFLECIVPIGITREDAATIKTCLEEALTEAFVLASAKSPSLKVARKMQRKR